MSSTVLLGYNPNDFFYVDAENQGYWDPNECSSDNIKNLDPADKCNETNFKDNGKNCVSYELCKNKELATQIMEKQTTHGGEEKKYYDSAMSYDIALMDIVNLGIGIIFIIAIIYRNRNMK